MAIQYLKKGITEQERSTEDNKVKNIVEETLKKIEQQGDHYIRELSEKFDNYSPKSFKLSDSEIQNLINDVSEDDIDHIKFAQKQVRQFAEAQLSTLKE